MFFNLFSEAEPFAAILIAQGTQVWVWAHLQRTITSLSVVSWSCRYGHMSFGGSWGLRNSRPKAESGGRGSWGGEQASPHQLGDLGSTVISPSRVRGAVVVVSSSLPKGARGTSGAKRCPTGALAEVRAVALWSLSEKWPKIGKKFDPAQFFLPGGSGCRF